MKLETLEDLLEINTDILKAPENKRILTKVKQLIKSNNKVESTEEGDLNELPYEAVSIVGNLYVDIRFDLETKKATIASAEPNERDSKGRNYMAANDALKKLQFLSKNQKEIEHE